MECWLRGCNQAQNSQGVSTLPHPCNSLQIKLMSVGLTVQVVPALLRAMFGMLDRLAGLQLALHPPNITKSFTGSAFGNYGVSWLARQCQEPQWHCCYGWVCGHHWVSRGLATAGLTLGVVNQQPLGMVHLRCTAWDRQMYWIKSTHGSATDCCCCCQLQVPMTSKICEMLHLCSQLAAAVVDVLEDPSCHNSKIVQDRVSCLSHFQPNYFYYCCALLRGVAAVQLW